MPSDRTALRALLLAAIASAPLSACLDKDEDDDDTGTTVDADADTDVDIDADTDVDTDADTDADTDTDGGTTGAYPALPDGDYPECEGEKTTSSGPCCTDVYCTSGDACKDAAEMEYDDVTELVGTSLGSGTCQCGEVTGPYAPRAEDDGECCYLVPLQGCEGRPLVIAGAVRRATVRRGASAWNRRA